MATLSAENTKTKGKKKTNITNSKKKKHNNNINNGTKKNNGDDNKYNKKKPNVDYKRKLTPLEFREDYADYQDFTGQGVQIELQVAMWLKKSNSFWKRLRFIKSTDVAEKVFEQVKDMEEEFTFSISYEPKLLADFARYGFLPMCIQCAADLAVFTPKLHRNRSLLDFKDLYVSKNTRKKSKNFYVSIDECFDFCIQQCCKQHGDHCWFYPALIQSYRHIFDRNDQGGLLGVTMHSIEVWSNDGSVVAGEVGYAIAGVYTSLSGFKLLKSAGTIQLSVVPAILKSCGFDFWDLGMHMKYKEKLGAKKTPRKEFVNRLFESKEKHPVSVPLTLSPSLPRNCKQLVDLHFNINNNSKKKC